jgi:signal transduction histidine kinase
MKFKLENKIRLGFGACFLLLTIAFLVSIISTNKLLRQIQLVNYNSWIMQTLDNLASAVKDLSSSTRGFILTNQPQQIKQYRQAMGKTDTLTRQLQTTLRYNESYTRSLDIVASLLKEEYRLVQQATSLHMQTGVITPQIEAISREEAGITDRVINQINYIKAIEKVEFDKKMDRLMYYNNFVKNVNITSLILVIIVVGYSLFIYNRENKAKMEADRKTQNYQEQLKKRILDLKKANEELQILRGNEKFSATGRVARTIAHEIRNPLTNINLAYAHLSGEQSLEPHKSLLDVIKSNSDRINHMITDLLNSTRFLELQFSKVSVNLLLNETLAAAQDSLALKNIQVVKNFSPAPCEVWVDPEKIKIAFFNIIVNAIDAMEAGKGVLTLKTEVKMNHKCLIVIADNGSGIPEDMLNKLFDPYFTSKPSGTGLGLTNTQNIILNHKGAITVESKTGIGTRFIISLSTDPPKVEG